MHLAGFPEVVVEFARRSGYGYEKPVGVPGRGLDGPEFPSRHRDGPLKGSRDVEPGVGDGPEQALAPGVEGAGGLLVA